MSDAKRLLIIDGDNYLCRAFFATSGKMTAPNGVDTNAIKGFINILLADMFKLRPTHVCIVFDKRGVNWRRDIHPEYKANRRIQADAKDPRALKRLEENKSMREQKPYLKKLLRAMGFRLLTRAGVEGDDFVGTIAVQYAERGFKVIMASNDKDMAQLVGGNIKIMNPKREILDAKGIKKQFGVRPDQIVDFLSLIGDGVDNIPGIRGIGGKTAIKLLTQFDNLEGVMKNRTTLTPALAKSLEGKTKQLKLNRKLITLKTDESHSVTAKQMRVPSADFDEKKVAKLCKLLGMKATQKEITRSYAAWKARS